MRDHEKLIIDAELEGIAGVSYGTRCLHVELKFKTIPTPLQGSYQRSHFIDETQGAGMSLSSFSN